MKNEKKEWEFGDYVRSGRVTGCMRSELSWWDVGGCLSNGWVYEDCVDVWGIGMCVCVCVFVCEEFIIHKELNILINVLQWVNE